MLGQFRTTLTARASVVLTAFHIACNPLGEVFPVAIDSESRHRPDQDKWPKRSLLSFPRQTFDLYFPHYRTNGSPVWKPECLWRTRRRSGGIFTSVRLSTSLWAGLGEGAFAHAGFQRRRSSNLASCPPTPVGSGARASIVFGACHAI